LDLNTKKNNIKKREKLLKPKEKLLEENQDRESFALSFLQFKQKLSHFLSFSAF
jgi:hypothetical protein